MANSEMYVYVSQQGAKQISVYRMSLGGELSKVQDVSVAGKAMPMAVSPDRRFLFIALRTELQPGGGPRGSPYRVDQRQRDRKAPSRNRPVRSVLIYGALLGAGAFPRWVSVPLVPSIAKLAIE